MSRSRSGLRWFLGILAVVAFVVITARLWLALLGGFLVKADGAAPADMIVVLAGDFSGNRILTGADLVRKGIAPKALISGPAEAYGHHESDLAIAFATARGYPESYFIALPNDARSTKSEADAVLAELRRLGAHRIDIVTSNYHTRRAGNIYRSKARDLEIRMVSAPDRFFEPDSWWKSRDAQKIFVVEWMKTAATWIGL